MNIGELYATLGIDTAGLMQAEKDMLAFQRSSQESLNRINSSLEKTGKQMKEIGKGLSMYMSLPLAAVGAGAAKLATDFDDALSKVIGLVGQSSQQVAVWREELLKMSGEVGRGPKELADALYFVTSAGIETSKVMDVVKISAQAASAGLGETQVIADMVTSALNAYGTSNLSASQAVDMLVAAVREGKSEAPAMAESLGAVIPLAAQMGVKFDQVAAAMASMSLTGTNAAEASTMLRGMLTALISPSEKAEKAMNSMGTSSAELRNTIKNEGLMGAMADLRDLTKEYGETVVAEVFPEVRAMMGVLSLMGNNFEKNNEIINKVTNSTGDMQKAFDQAAKSAKYTYNEAIEASKVAMISLGTAINDAVLPAVRWMAKVLGELATWFSGLSRGSKTLILAIGGIAIAIGPLLTVMGILISSVIPAMITGGTALANMFVFLKVAIMNNPLGLLLTVLTSVAAWFLLTANNTDTATRAQLAYNEAVKAGNKLRDESKSIDDSMLAVRSMNGVQLTALKDRIATQKKLETDYTLSLKQEALKRFAEDDVLLKYQKDIVKESNGIAKAGIAVKIKHRKEELIEELEIQNKAQQERIKKLNEYENQVQAVIAAQPKPLVGASSGGVLSPEALANMSYDAELQLTKMNEYLSNVDAAKLAIKKAMAVGPDASGSTFMNNLIGNADAQLAEMNKLNAIQDVFDGVSMGMEEMTQKSKIFGSSLNTVDSQIALYSSALQSLQGMDVSLITPEQLVMISSYVDKLEQMGYAFQNTISSSQLASENMHNLGSIFNSIGGAIDNTTGAWLSYVGNVLGTIPQLIAAIAAYTSAKATETAANSAAAVTGATASGAVMPFPYNLLAIGAGVAAVLAALAMVPKMATGGVIPSGYPNDTYPALLSSGETVVPPGKLDQLMNSGNRGGNRGGIIQVRIGNRELVGTLINESKFKRSF